MQKDVIKLRALPQIDILLSSHLGYLYRVQEESLGANTKQGISLYLILMYPFKMCLNILYCRRDNKKNKLNADSIIFKKSPKIGKNCHISMHGSSRYPNKGCLSFVLLYLYFVSSQIWLN
jgi:hypothetical protein